jgi:hypothetical protein
MSKVITHPLLVRPSSATRGLIGVVPNQIAAAYNAARQIIMGERPSPAEFLVISREQWDSTLSPKERHKAIDKFYAWLEGEKVRCIQCV